MQCSVTGGTSRCMVVWGFVASRTSAPESDGDRVPGSGLPVSWIQFAASKSRSFFMLTRLPPYALCDGSCAKNGATERHLEALNRPVGRSL